MNTNTNSGAHPMQQYHDLMARAIQDGAVQYNVRTGINCHVLVGERVRFDLRDGFPATTTKKLAFKSMTGELLGFFRGYTNAADFRSLGCGVWDDNANRTPAWLANRHRKGTDDLGRIYSSQWVDHADRRVATSEAERDAMLNEGFRVGLYDPERKAWMMERSINQVENALRTIITNPSDRRIIVSGWNVGEQNDCALPACHVLYNFVANEGTKELHLVMAMRSTDLFLGLNFNQASCALFLSIMARLSGYTPATLTITMANAHVYANHIDQVREQLTRDHFPQPTLVLDPSIKKIENLDEIAGVFTRITPDQIRLEGYQSHAAIKAPMAA